MNQLLRLNDGTIVNIPAAIEQYAPKDLIFLGYRGSHSHGTFVPSSNPDSIDDIDLLGVFFGPIEHYLGFGRQETIEHQPNSEKADPWDLVFYEFRKFVSLLEKNNPNVLALLWLEDSSIVQANDYWTTLVANRDLFKSKTAFASFTGLAKSQLKKMTALNQEARDEITRREFALQELGLEFPNGRPVLPPGAHAQIQEAVRQYNELVSRYFNGYMGHKRKSLVIKHGYDTKNAAHLIRALRVCVEFLQTSEMIVKRPDAQELIAIKQGQWPLEQVHEEAELLFTRAQEAYHTSSLPEKPDRAKIETLMVNLLKQHLEETNA
jgi:predicted nucleotidyltransferase